MCGVTYPSVSAFAGHKNQFGCKRRAFAAASGGDAAGAPRGAPAAQAAAAAALALPAPAPLPLQLLAPPPLGPVGGGGAPPPGPGGGGGGGAGAPPPLPGGGGFLAALLAGAAAAEEAPADAAAQFLEGVEGDGGEGGAGGGPALNIALDVRLLAVALGSSALFFARHLLPPPRPPPIHPFHAGCVPLDGEGCCGPAGRQRGLW